MKSDWFVSLESFPCICLPNAFVRIPSLERCRSFQPWLVGNWNDCSLHLYHIVPCVNNLFAIAQRTRRTNRKVSVSFSVFQLRLAIAIELDKCSPDYSELSTFTPLLWIGKMCAQSMLLKATRVWVCEQRFDDIACTQPLVSPLTDRLGPANGRRIEADRRIGPSAAFHCRFVCFARVSVIRLNCLPSSLCEAVGLLVFFSALLGPASHQLKYYMRHRRLSRITSVTLKSCGIDMKTTVRKSVWRAKVPLSSSIGLSIDAFENDSWNSAEIMRYKRWGAHKNLAKLKFKWCLNTNKCIILGAEADKFPSHTNAMSDTFGIKSTISNAHILLFYGVPKSEHTAPSAINTHCVLTNVLTKYLSTEPSAIGTIHFNASAFVPEQREAESRLWPFAVHSAHICGVCLCMCTIVVIWITVWFLHHL